MSVAGVTVVGVEITRLQPQGSSAAYGAIAPKLATGGAPPLVTAALVAGIGVPGGLIEISAIAAVLPDGVPA